MDSEERYIYTLLLLLLVRFLFFYLAEREYRQGDSEDQQEPEEELIPGPRDHDLSRKQMSNCLSHPGNPK